MITQKEKAYLQELARRYRELADSPKNSERRERMRKINDLTTGLRPGVWIHEIPWHEMNINDELTLICEDSFAREMEWYFKTSLYRIKYIEADTVLTPYYPISKSYFSSSNGIDSEEDIVKTDDKNGIVSHSYHDKLETEEQLSKLITPILTAYPEKDIENITLAADILADILPVRLMGHQIYYAPWDEIPRIRGVEPILLDMFDRPEFLHKIIAKYTENQMSVMTQMETLGLLENELESIHCTPAYTNDLPKLEQDGKIRLNNVWFRSMAQMFNTVSPSMHEEFDLQYSRPLAAQCGMVYYGCCEPLDNKIEILRSIPNLRKLGVSPWSKLEVTADQMRSDYVFARKPNPAFVAGTFDPDTVRKEITETVELCLKYNCPYEFVLKDISTVGYRPENLIEWNKVVTQVLDKYYK